MTDLCERIRKTLFRSRFGWNTEKVKYQLVAECVLKKMCGKSGETELREMCVDLGLLTYANQNATANGKRYVYVYYMCTGEYFKEEFGGVR